MVRQVTAMTAYLTLCLLVLHGVASAAQPTIRAVKVDSPPALDGDLSDECWAQAPSVEEFFFPADGAKAAEPTTVWLCYDHKNIYMAFRCRDSQPERIIAQQKKRGGDLGTDDWVGFDLDCYNKYRHISWFDVSAGGVQVESLQSGDVSKIEWKGDWNSAARRTPDGYVVELAIPWAILQYDANSTSMGIAFIRRHARSKQWWWAPNVGPNTDARNFYLWQGLELPRPVNRPMMMAYSLVGAGDGLSTGRAGLDMKYAVTPSLTGSLTMNPDFRNVEQAVDSVDFSYNERWLPDSRPFFQEGSGHFPTEGIFYTRRIKDIDTGLKLSGRVGNYGIGALHTESFGSEHHSLLQISRQWEDRTWIWACGIESHTPTLNNTVGYFVLDQIVAGKGESEVKATASYSTAGAPDDQGSRYVARLQNRFRPRKLRWQLSYTALDEDYYPYLGLVGDTGIRETGITFSTYDELSQGSMEEWYLEASAYKTTAMDGSDFGDGVGVYGSLDWRNGTGAHINLRGSSRLIHDDYVAQGGYYWGGRDLYKNGSVGLALGRQASGAYLRWSVAQGWQISDRLSVRGSYEHARIKEPSPEAFRANLFITSLIYDIDNERTLGGRLVANKGKNNVYLTYRQRLRSGPDLYLIFGDPNAESTRSSFTLKFIRLL